MDTPAPKRFVRTFAGDIQTIKEGGKPNLAPFKKPEPLKTYSGDFSDKVEETGASTTTILAAEQDAAAKFQEEIAEKPFRRENKLYAIAGAVLLLVGIVGAYIAYASYLAKITPVAVTNTVFSPIFTDEREKISGTTHSAVLQAIKQSLTRPLLPNNVRLLYIDSTAEPNTSVFSILQLNAPDVLLRNINNASSIAGIINSNDPSSPLGSVNQNPFFILSVASYGDTFAGMLSWEPRMPQDLEILFLQNPSQPTNGQSSTTTELKIVKVVTQTPTAKAPISAFRDEAVGNHDVRIYRDDTGKNVLLYGYWNQTTLVIARDHEAFAEIIKRLATARARN